MARQKDKETKETPRYIYTGHEDIPDSYTEITGAEYKALLSINSTDARWIYFVLSFHRNFETGIAGLNPKISSAMLRGTISHQSAAGKKERKISNNHIQRWIDQLEKAGLIQDRGNHVFYLPMARKHPRKENKSNSICNTSHVTVTKPVTNIEKTSDETPINTGENANSQLLQTLSQTGDLSQEKEGGLSQGLLPIQNNRLDKIRSDGAEKTLTQVFMDLLAKRGFYLNHVTHSKTVAMLHAWIKGGITPEEADIAMTHCDNQLGRRPDHPTYYAKVPFQYRQDLEKANLNAEEIKHAPKSTKYQNNSAAKPSRVSKTQMFYDSCFTGLRDHYNRSKD